ncbi:hypothetical protein DFJ77DRAFT_14756 [Powellomyces hirtus]|nr:hypothetical protein DFJ77DRAFT_14756 [Powellomyces hirtus]
MTDHGTYAALAGLPVVSKVYRPPATVSLPPSIYTLVQSAEQRKVRYDFEFERSVIQEVERFTQQLERQEAARQEKLDKIDAERREWEKKQAPGLSSDGRIMQPVSIANPPPSKTAESGSSSVPGPSITTTSAIPSSSQEAFGLGPQARMPNPSPLPSDLSNSPTPPPPSTMRAYEQQPQQLQSQQQPDGKKQRPGLDYLEFEQGLPPPDPWRTQDDDDDLRMLKEVMGGPEPKSSHPITSTFHSTKFFGASPTKIKETVLAHTGDAVSRARALMANLAIHIPQSHSQAVPSPPPKPVGLQLQGSGSALPPATRKPASMQYPVLPGIANPNGGGVEQSARQSQSDSSKEDDAPKGLSATTRETFKKMTQMGFSREAVDRGINLFGCDEKKILDFAIGFDEHRRAGFSGDDVQIAVGLFNHDVSKERQFLVAFAALVDFGFPKRRIQEALVLKNNNKEQALEYLVAEGK